MRAISVAGEAISDLSKDAVLILKAMRPAEWIKNFFVFAPVFFSGEVDQLDKLALASTVFLAFSLMSSAVYLLNDISDRELDRTHPQKRNRPIASGALSVGTAGASAGLLVACHWPSFIFRPSLSLLS